MIYWAINILILTSLSWFSYRYFRQSINLPIYLSALILKLSAGLVLGWIFYTHYKSGDTIAYFDDARAIASLGVKDYLNVLFQGSTYEITNHPRVLFFSKFLSLFMRVTGDSYWISSLYLSFISFIGSCYIVRTLNTIYPNLKNLNIGIFFFIPTVVFWSSGILKDTLAYGAFLCLTALVLLLYHKKRISIAEIVVGLLSAFILWRIRHYLLIGIILFSGILFFLKLIQESSKLQKVWAVVLLAIASLSTQFVHPFLNLQRLPITLYENNQAITQKTRLTNQLDIVIEKPDWSSVIEEVPQALKTGLFRPSVLDNTPVWGIFHQVENFFILTITVLTILLILKMKPKIDFPIIVAAILVIMVLATMLALSTPNFGTLVRYKNAFIPFLILLSSILPYRYFTAKTEE